MINSNTSIDEKQIDELWYLLEQLQDIFAWHKGELGHCTIDEDTIDTQGLLPCQMTPRRPSYWQIQALVDLGKMCKSASEYVRRIILPINKDGSRRLCGDYCPLNAQR